MGDLTNNFSSSEFACPCCGKSEMDPQFMDRLQALRSEYGDTILIAKGGGFRCENYDTSNSAHKEGKAADLLYPRRNHYRLLQLAFKHGFTGIGDKNKNGYFQLHVDTADDIPNVRPRPLKWTYNTKGD